MTLLIILSVVVDRVPNKDKVTQQGHVNMTFRQTSYIAPYNGLELIFYEYLSVRLKPCASAFEDRPLSFALSICSHAEFLILQV